MPQLVEDVKNMVYQQDRTPSHIRSEVGSCLDEIIPSRWTGRGGPMNCPSGYIPIYLVLFWSFLKDENVPPLRQQLKN